jgi:hypothetical protein
MINLQEYAIRPAIADRNDQNKSEAPKIKYIKPEVDIGREKPC